MTRGLLGTSSKSSSPRRDKRKNMSNNRPMNTLRKFSLAVLTIAMLALLLAPVAAFSADAGACYSIADPDRRAFCLAKAHKDPGRCYAIQDQALRAECLAETR